VVLSELAPATWGAIASSDARRGPRCTGFVGLRYRQTLGRHWSPIRRYAVTTSDRWLECRGDATTNSACMRVIDQRLTRSVGGRRRDPAVLVAHGTSWPYGTPDGGVTISNPNSQATATSRGSTAAAPPVWQPTG